MARILITGSNSGFGLLSALTLARQGHDVIASMRNPAKSDALDHAVAAEELSITKRTLDVADQASVDAALADADDIDVLINNAGYEVQSSVEQLSDELMYGQLETNVMGPLRTMRAVLPSWRERGSGVIVNVSSIAGRVGTPYSGAYAASKWALEAMSESLHFEVSQLGIRVHLIEPGRFDTGFRDNIVRPPDWEGSYHHERFEAFRRALDSLDTGDGDAPGTGDSGGTKPDPQTVADAIVRGATDPSTPLRTLVGADAELIAGVKGSMDFEDFEATMRSALNWHD